MRKHDPLANARWRYIITYVLVSVLPLLLCAGIILIVNLQKSRTQLEQAMFDKLELVKTQLDLTFNKLESAGMHFTSSEVWAEDGHSGQDDSICAQLYAYSKTYSFVDDVVYLPVGKPYIYTPSQQVPYLEFCSQKAEQNFLDMSSFFMYMNTLDDSMLLPTHRFSQRYVDGDHVLFLQPVPHLGAVRKGAIAFFIPSQTIYAMFEVSFFDSAGYYYILDENMSIVYTNESGQEADALRVRMSHLHGTGLFHQQVDNRDYVLLRTVSDTSGAYYMAAVPADVFYAQVGDLLYNQVAALVGSLLLVAMFSILLALLFYRPLEKFLRNLSSQTNIAYHSHTQVLQNADSHVKWINADRAALSAQLNDHYPVLLRQLVSGLLYGQLNEFGATLLLEQLRLSWHGNRFVAMHVWLAECSEKLIPIEHWQIQHGKVYAIPNDQGNQIAMLAEVTPETGMEPEALRLNASQDCQQHLEQTGRPFILLGVGSLRTQFMELDASYLEAQSLGRDLHAIEHPTIGLYRPSASGILTDSFLPLAEKELLVQCIISGNAKSAGEAVNLLQENLRAFVGNRTLMRSVFFYLYDAMNTAASSLQLSVPRSGLNQGIASASLEEFMHALHSFLKEACAQTEKRRQHSASYTKHKILQYVHENFREHTLSMDELCERFDLSASYLARFFKQETGYSFLQYTGNLRMLYVKTQLAQTEKPIKDIVLEAGYLDAASFIRKFRQQEGMTPGEYRTHSFGEKKMDNTAKISV